MAARIVGALVLIPFLLFGFGVLAVAGYIVLSMISNDVWHAGFVLLAAALAGGALFALRKTIPSVLRIFTPGALFPLGIDQPGPHRYESDL